jgi:hypothetical protein
MPHTVRTTMRPDQEIEVGDAEYTDLHRQGLLLEDPTPPPVTPQAAKKAAQSAPPKEG